MCGNGARCFARYASRLAGNRERVTFETIAGVISAELVGDLVRLGMSDPRDLRLNQPVPVDGQTLTAHFVDTGVPHAVVVVDNLATVHAATLGAAIRFHQAFAPRGTNVNFIHKLDQAPEPNTIAIRTYERGVEAETLACGTGVVASALIFHELTGARSPVYVQVRGGDTLCVGFNGGPGTYRDVTLTGPAQFVFEGTI
jgi:diaminopimelate epimerase